MPTLSLVHQPQSETPAAIATAAATGGGGGRDAFLWFWGCDDDSPTGTVDPFFSLLAPSVFSRRAAPNFVTGLIPAW
eukprot:SAG22_NODE_942_length_6401_cov_9.094000_8_plen_77_part_00